ncbi:MAG: YihY/virulence factor BrkB family protein [Candidatus Binatia bacterium]
MLERLYDRLSELVWKEPEGEVPTAHRYAQRAGRLVWLAAEGFHADSCSLRASALTLATTFALVPVMAASFAYVRGLGWSGQRLESLLLQRVTLLSPEAVSTVVSWIDNISITGLGLMGALFAIASAISLLLQVESAFDAVWGNTNGRGQMRRSADALMLLVFAPVMIAAAASSEAALRSSSAVAWLGGFGGFEFVIRTLFSLTWDVLICVAFAAIYLFLPAATVDRRAAMVGGLVAGISWQFAQKIYVDFQIGLGGYNTVYGALAQLPVLVLWLWTSWVLVLAGAEIAAAWQNLAACRGRYAPALVGGADRERLALSIALELADASYARRAAPTLANLAELLARPVRSVSEVFAALVDAGVVHTGGEEQRRCFLSLSPGSIPVERIIAAARGDRDELVPETRPVVSQVLARFAAARREAFGNATLADLVDPRN